MRIVSVLAGLLLGVATTNVLARGSRCQRVACECAPVVCCSAAACVKPTTVCCTPQPTSAVLEERTVPIAATGPAEEKARSVKRPKPLRMQDLAPELDAYLAEWEKASSKIRRLDCEFLKFIYDPIFEVEKRGRGTIAVEQDRPARYRIFPAALIPGDVSKKKRNDGSPYTLEACVADCWQWTGSELFKFDEQERSYERIDIPPSGGPEVTGFFRFMEQLKELPFAKPFLLGMPAKQLKKRFNIMVRKQSGDELWLEFVPRRSEDAFNYEKAVLILDHQSWLPRALKMIDPTGCQTVHIFENVKVNAEEGDDLTKVNLEGYRNVLSNEPLKTETSE